MLIVCRRDWRNSFQFCGIKQEQDLFLRFSTKKAVDSLEKVAIVPILDRAGREQHKIGQICGGSWRI
ncbi:hypothetical protein [Vibrio sp. CAU 1672]|uniref:hypothetical protein n=1 Tax=Vibrio sp. CAU 1672 TaxID=3032594 RepID=UPI0023DACCB6|nr:hypothetical protein [Vibrio sp. CAU 1672]MDF2153574.1 hypothetical protein [Vibrio sp. CAU 1672]